jgi:N-acetylneuraminic acid mutarotase
LIKTLLQQKEPHIMMMRMRKSIALLLVLVFLTAPYLMAMPARSSTVSTNVTENTWVTKTPMHQARGFLGVAAVNGKIYAIGGSAKDVRLATTKEFLSTNEEYDPETDTWISKKGMPTQRAAFAIATYQNKIYCVGGKNGDGYAGVNEVYDTQTDTWETKKPMPTARGFVTANVVNGRIYVIGGSIIGGGTTINEVYDPATDSWTTKTSMPAHGGSVSTVFDNKIYLMSGSEFLIYEPATDEWNEGTSKPSSVGGVLGAGVTTGNMAPKRIYTIGDRVGVYDPKNDTWTIGALKPTSQTDFGVAVVNDLIYAVGGDTYDALYAIYGPGIGHFEPLALNEQYTPLDYGTILPKIIVDSPENRIYNSSSLSLIFTVDKTAVWLGYSLDGQETVAVAGNTTITGLTNGVHNVTVYAKDAFNNTGVSEIAYFSVDMPEPQPEPPTLPTVVVIASLITVAVVSVGLRVYFKKRKR